MLKDNLIIRSIGTAAGADIEVNIADRRPVSAGIRLEPQVGRQVEQHETHERSDCSVDKAPELRHFTREPWWVVALAGVVMALFPLWKYGRVQELMPGVSLPLRMALFGGMGVVGSSILVARSYVRSPFWSNVVLWLGIFVIAAGVSIGLVIMSD